jgi:hypothetical protein
MRLGKGEAEVFGKGRHGCLIGSVAVKPDVTATQLRSQQPPHDRTLSENKSPKRMFPVCSPEKTTDDTATGSRRVCTDHIENLEELRQTALRFLEER